MCARVSATIVSGSGTPMSAFRFSNVWNWDRCVAGSGPQADSRVGRRMSTLRVVTTAAERPILSGRFSAIQGVKWPYVGKILDTSEEGFAVPSGT